MFDVADQILTFTSHPSMVTWESQSNITMLTCRLLLQLQKLYGPLLDLTQELDQRQITRPFKKNGF